MNAVFHPQNEASDGVNTLDDADRESKVLKKTSSRNRLGDDNRASELPNPSDVVPSQQNSAKQINKLPPSNPTSNIQSIQGKYNKHVSMNQSSLNNSLSQTQQSYQNAYEPVTSNSGFLQSQAQPVQPKKPDNSVATTGAPNSATSGNANLQPFGAMRS